MILDHRARHPGVHGALPFSTRWLAVLADVDDMRMGSGHKFQERMCARRRRPWAHARISTHPLVNRDGSSGTLRHGRRCRRHCVDAAISVNVRERLDNYGRSIMSDNSCDACAVPSASATFPGA